jgi:hypothetical protein
MFTESVLYNLMTREVNPIKINIMETTFVQNAKFTEWKDFPVHIVIDHMILYGGRDETPRWQIAGMPWS